MDKITKLSQAIRLGATFRPQGHGEYFADGNSCAIGAALEACGWGPDEESAEPHGALKEALLKRFGFVTGIPGEGLGIYSQLWADIYKRNDDGETREQIADWLEAQGL